MARTSGREDKNVYWQARDKMGWTREEAGDHLETIPPERVARIEYEQFLPHPDEVLVMAEKYKEPMLCNYYCSQQCPIGQQYVPEIDNGPMEGFWGILKRERYYGRRFTSREELVSMIENYIVYYNNRRVQRNLGVLTPMEKHQSYLLAA